jgi:glutamate synthase domain-containing protein 1
LVLYQCGNSDNAKLQFDRLFNLADNSELGETAKSTEPKMVQIFIENTKNLPTKDFERELYKIRKLAAFEAGSHPDVG